MNIVALIPFWFDYKSVNSDIAIKPISKLGGLSLINRTIVMLNNVKDIRDVVIFSSNNKVLDFVDKDLQFSFLQRDKFLDSDTISIEDIIENFLLDSDSDIVVLVHPKSPFLKSKTIQACIDQVKSNDYDSAFTAVSIRKQAWFKGKRLNYSFEEDTPPVDKIEPILVETASVYVFTKKTFNSYHSRIGNKPYVKHIGDFEGLEVMTEEDSEVAELIINSGLDIEKK